MDAITAVPTDSTDCQPVTYMICDWPEMHSRGENGRPIFRVWGYLYGQKAPIALVWADTIRYH